ncbi:hypothetical protein SISSUDRAFT_418129 [Sistotremastrum suecicum HHB10207 ss-3]|uniref:Uncharacterized protein n=1 Tax=Sistotremastrum suecicum HHB10207 ss-3 TaxID=1314776 RepID=A0A165YM78_9AGAM|nr:hypothetical protein SISSUDRAFT_418129 [Sistotremastrum suecicum HHB10207 ss-3]
MRHEERKALAWSWLAPLIWLLFGTLLLAISLFVVGYLYQLQVLSTSFSGPAPILRAAYIIAIILALCVLVLLALTVVHGVLIPNSPFEGPLSKSLLSLIPSRMRRSDRFTILTSNNRDREWEETRAAREEAVSTYARLISETNDPNLLDRAAPSLVFKECMSSASLPHLIAATRRLLSTDTSIRVKATVRTQYDAFIGWLQNDPVIHVQQSNALSVDDVRDIIRWKNECSTLLQIKSERIWFSPVNVILTSFLPHNKDLLPIGRLPFEQCIARVLCIFDQSRQLGDCEDVLRHAMGHCNWLIAHQKVDDVTRILSHVDRNSLLRSLIRNTCLNWPLIRDIVGILIQGREEETLVEMAPFLTGLPDVGRVFGSFIVVDFLEELAQRLGSDLRTPADIDFSRLCSLIIQEYSSTTWTKEASIVMLYREHSETLQVADKAIARDFFRLCLLRSEEDSVGISSLRVPYCLGERAQFYLSCLTGALSLAL